MGKFKKKKTFATHTTTGLLHKGLLQIKKRVEKWAKRMSRQLMEEELQRAINIEMMFSLTNKKLRFKQTTISCTFTYQIYKN